MQTEILTKDFPISYGEFIYMTSGNALRVEIDITGYDKGMFMIASNGNDASYSWGMIWFSINGQKVNINKEMFINDSKRLNVRYGSVTGTTLIIDFDNIPQYSTIGVFCPSRLLKAYPINV